MAGQAPARVQDAGGFPAPTADLERGRAVYVLNACHFCHGLDLTGAVMGATDLMHAPIVAADDDGNVIGVIVRAGKPNLQTSMPSYRDLSAAEITDLARYVHYLRQVGRYRELTSQPSGAGDKTAGAAYFKATCARCHDAAGDLRGVAAKYGTGRLRERILRPAADAVAPSDSSSRSAGLREHAKLLERYADADVSNVTAYLQSAIPPADR
jgi:mono/diheme cytochrome c family protein